MVDDVQDSDQEMEDCGEDSEEDEGSLYAPTEATSELSEEEPIKLEDLMELPLEDPCKLLVLLPRELRDKVCTLNAPFCIRAHALTISLRI